ncbi:hypothetical protein EBAPG3_010100 [Nitrosospira lacus]|uniref:Uncharacterized protein n=1 Tax=Nitrosospira lacus TaxID=1288494 RepID=A0A1W6SQP7_9PROT|nr:hypothetical protein [Nitrosospira lacus]ARO88095.3 hypothetical protein EBAPG3_010100 [Nitrosospira lacus]
MTYNLRSLRVRHIGLRVLVLALFISSIGVSTAYAGQTESRAAAKGASGSSRSAEESMTDFEKMELYYRRYSAAANNMAELVKQLNLKIQDVSLAAKTVEAKSSSHNKRLLEEKLRHLESARISTGHQYAQLQSQMQNEYRSYTAISSNLKTRYDPAGDSGTVPKTVTETKVQTPKAKDARAWDSKSGDMKASEIKIQEPPIEDFHVSDPKVMNLDTKELRARRDAGKNLNSGQTTAPPPASEPVLSPVR